MTREIDEAAARQTAIEAGGYRNREIGRKAERAWVLGVLREHLSWYPKDVFDDAAGRAIRWKLEQLIREFEKGDER